MRDACPPTSAQQLVIILLVIIALSTIAAMVFISEPISVEEETAPLDPFQEPIQNDIQNVQSFTMNKGSLQLLVFPRAKYEITAQVVSKKRYRDGWASKIAPYDFALAWGRLIESEISKFIMYSQIKRFYFFTCKWNCPVTQNYIGDHSSNNHLMPANINIFNALKKIKEGNTIQLWGYLVNVEGMCQQTEVNWASSTTREDTGNGACELIYVEKIRLKNKIYR
ncbi:MAG: hypothetical protein J7M10_07860 [Candidatus Cloacimonetes bacterium]|nr:hypothetical protein [Candidatus Cloacimonadota bacterium]